MCDFRSFLEHEKQISIHNIERQNKALEWYQDGDSLAKGHQKLIAVQKRHIAMIDTLLEGKVNVDMTLATCEQALKLAEEKHRQMIIRHEENDELWWETSDVIQFVSSLIYRIEDWKCRHQQTT